MQKFFFGYSEVSVIKRSVIWIPSVLTSPNVNFQVPPSVPGLIRAIESKYKINARNIRYLYKKNKEGALVKLDDDMIKYYCNEDIFLMQVKEHSQKDGSRSVPVLI